jgi:hypothetical protein
MVLTEGTRQLTMQLEPTFDAFRNLQAKESVSVQFSLPVSKNSNAKVSRIEVPSTIQQF